MTLLEQIESRLALCAKATPGPWGENSGCASDTGLELFVTCNEHHETVAKVYTMGDREFIAASRNQREGELAALKESLRCIEQFRSQNHRRGYPTGPEWMALISGAETAVAQITKLLSGDSKDLGEGK